MKLFRSIVELQNELFEVRKEGKNVGIVPTMGALHEGHASLVKRSVKENDVTVYLFSSIRPSSMTKKTWSAIRAHLMQIVPCSNHVVQLMCLPHQWRRCIQHQTSVSLIFRP